MQSSPDGKRQHLTTEFVNPPNECLVTTYSTGIQKLFITETHHNVIKAFSRRIITALEKSSRCNISNITIQVAFDSSWVPYIVTARDIILSDASYNWFADPSYKNSMIYSSGLCPVVHNSRDLRPELRALAEEEIELSPIPPDKPKIAEIPKKYFSIPMPILSSTDNTRSMSMSSRRSTEGEIDLEFASLLLHATYPQSRKLSTSANSIILDDEVVNSIILTDDNESKLIAAPEIIAITDGDQISLADLDLQSDILSVLDVAATMENVQKYEDMLNQNNLDSYKILSEVTDGKLYGNISAKIKRSLTEEEEHFEHMLNHDEYADDVAACNPKPRKDLQYPNTARSLRTSRQQYHPVINSDAPVDLDSTYMVSTEASKLRSTAYSLQIKPEDWKTNQFYHRESRDTRLNRVIPASNVR